MLEFVTGLVVALALMSPWMMVWWFAVFCAAIFCISGERNSRFLAMPFLLAAVFVHSWWFGNLGWVQDAIANPWVAAKYIGLYLLAGFVWSAVRWGLVNLDARRRYREARERSAYTTPGMFVPDFYDYSASIAGWFLLWPLSIFWFAFSEGLYRLAMRIVDTFSGSYRAVQNMIWDGDRAEHRAAEQSEAKT